jgi:hypothetical protein
MPNTVEANRLVGSWSLISYETTVEGATPETPFGPHPRGRLMLSPDGRMAVVMVGGERRYGLGDAERAALHRAMGAYSGTYRVEGNQFVTSVDLSWNLIWEGTEQVRHYRLEDDLMVLDLTGVRRADGRLVFAPQDKAETGTPLLARLVWKRE